jgi:hypothetical protein
MTRGELQTLQQVLRNFRERTHVADALLSRDAGILLQKIERDLMIGEATPHRRSGPDAAEAIIERLNDADVDFTAELYSLIHPDTPVQVVNDLGEDSFVYVNGHAIDSRDTPATG